MQAFVAVSRMKNLSVWEICSRLCLINGLRTLQHAFWDLSPSCVGRLTGIIRIRGGDNQYQSTTRDTIRTAIFKKQYHWLEYHIMKVSIGLCTILSQIVMVLAKLHQNGNLIKMSIYLISSSTTSYKGVPVMTCHIQFSFRNMNLKMSIAKLCNYSLDLNVPKIKVSKCNSPGRPLHQVRQ